MKYFANSCENVIFVKPQLKPKVMKGDTLFALIAGAAAGLTLGLLFAPESGEETRKKVKKAAIDGVDQMKDAYADLKDEAADTAFEMKARARLARRDLRNLKDTLKDQTSGLKEDARAKILEQLEKLENSLRGDDDLDIDEQASENA